MIQCCSHCECKKDLKYKHRWGRSGWSDTRGWGKPRWGMHMYVRYSVMEDSVHQVFRNIFKRSLQKFRLSNMGLAERSFAKKGGHRPWIWCAAGTWLSILWCFAMLRHYPCYASPCHAATYLHWRLTLCLSTKNLLQQLSLITQQECAFGNFGIYQSNPIQRAETATRHDQT